jgi:hypothetical protein
MRFPATSGQHGHRALQQGADGAGRQHLAMQPARPLLRLGFHGEVERRLVTERQRHRFGGGFAIMRDPTLDQPLRQIEHVGFDIVDDTSALARAAAQHGVDEARIFRRAPIGLHQPHREVDRGVIGHIHPEDLRSADQQRALRPRRIGRNAAVEQF